MTAWGHSVAPHGPRESPQRVLVGEKGNSRAGTSPDSRAAGKWGHRMSVGAVASADFKGRAPPGGAAALLESRGSGGRMPYSPISTMFPPESLAPCELGARDLAGDFQQHSVSGHSGPKQPVWGPVTTPFLPTAGHRGSAKFHTQDGPAMPTLHLGIPQPGPTRSPLKVAVTSAQTVPVNSSRHHRDASQAATDLRRRSPPWLSPGLFPYCAHQEWSHSTQQPPLPRAHLTCYLPSTHQTALQRERELRRTSVHSCPAQAMHHWAVSRDSPCWR